jgi:hypothetical protein
MGGMNDTGKKSLFRGSNNRSSSTYQSLLKTQTKENLLDCSVSLCPNNATDVTVTHRPLSQLPPRPEGRASQTQLQSLRYVSNSNCGTTNAKNYSCPSATQTQPVPGISCISLTPSVSHSTFGSTCTSCECCDDFGHPSSLSKEARIMSMSHRTSRRRRMVARAAAKNQERAPNTTISKSQAAYTLSLPYLASLIVEVEYLTFGACLAYVGVLYYAVPTKAFLALVAGTCMAILLCKTMADFLQAYVKQQWNLVQRNGLVSYVPETVRPLLDPHHGTSLHDVLSTIDIMP